MTVECAGGFVLINVNGKTLSGPKRYSQGLYVAHQTYRNIVFDPNKAHAPINVRPILGTSARNLSHYCLGLLLIAKGIQTKERYYDFCMF